MAKTAEADTEYDGTDMASLSDMIRNDVVFFVPDESMEKAQKIKTVTDRPNFAVTTERLAEIIDEIPIHWRFEDGAVNALGLPNIIGHQRQIKE